jgi:hypothetical protein
MESQGLLEHNKTPAAPLAVPMQKVSAEILMMVLMKVPTKVAKKASMTPYRRGHSTDCQIGSTKAWNASTKAPRMARRLVSSSASTKLLKMASKMAEVRSING